MIMGPFWTLNFATVKSALLSLTTYTVLKRQNLVCRKILTRQKYRQNEPRCSARINVTKTSCSAAASRLLVIPRFWPPCTLL